MKDSYKSTLDNCPLTFALSIIGGKWRLPIIWAINQNENIRYNELIRNINGISNMMLTQTLKELEMYDVISRVQYSEIPPRVEYALTDKGKKLIPALKSFHNWGELMQNNVK